MKKNKIPAHAMPALLLVIAAGIATGCKGISKVKDEPPNVVIIFMDDMGFGDLECYGGAPWEMPHINRLAAEGMRFTHFYVPQAVCSASRAALLTGCYPNRVGITGAIFPNRKTGLHSDEATIAEMLKGTGYATGMVGKWHLGNEPEFLPDRQGFDSYYGLPYSNDMWPVDYNGKPVGAGHRKARFPPLAVLETQAGVHKADTAKIIQTLEDQAQLTTLYTQKAVEFIRQYKQQSFFLYLAHSMPHVPIAVSEKFRGKSGDGLFADLMTEIDWSVGEVMKALEDAGISENTLVILTSDNGPWLSYGNHAGSSGGLREGKASTWEGGIRIPAIMRWPGQIPAGSICNRLSSTVDLLPTIAGFCGAALPENQIDGIDIGALLLQQPGAKPRKELALYYDRNSLKGIIKDQWKLVFPHTYTTYKKNLPGFDGWPGETGKDSTGLALYDLRHDPGETFDVKDHYPDIVGELSALADGYRQELGDDLTAIKGREAARRPAGKLSGKGF